MCNPNWRLLFRRDSSLLERHSESKFEMASYRLQSPTGTPAGRQWQPSSPQTPNPSVEGMSHLHSPWLDSLSPNLRDSPVFSPKHDSQMGLMDFNRVDDASPGLGALRSSTKAPPKTIPWCKRVLISKWSMILCLLLGVGGALGHHFLYDYLNGREVTEYQRWWLRLGQFISFVAKANFVIAALMAYQQVAWRAVGQKGFSLEAIDSLFGSAHNAMELLNREAWAKSWFVMFLAMYMWASPFVVIFTSATLDVIPGIIRNETTCPSVRTLNFFNEVKDSFNTPKKATNDIWTGKSLSFYNITHAGGNLNPNKSQPQLDIFEYWDQPSFTLETISSSVFSSGRAIQRENAPVEICGQDWDCSTTIHFVAPGYDCKELARGSDDSLNRFDNVIAPFDLNDLVPRGNFTYRAETTQGDYARPQIYPVKDGGIPKMKPPFPQNLGALRTEPIIWIGYAAVGDMTRKHADNSSQPEWDKDYTPVIFACQHRETNYTVNLNYTGGYQTYNVTNRNYLTKIIDTTYKHNISNDGTEDETTATPDDHYIFPRSDYATYRRVAAYHSLGKKLRDLLSGTVKFPGPLAKGNIETSKLIDQRQNLAVPNLQDAVTHLYEDLLISLLSNPQLLVVSWAANSSELSGIGLGGEETRYACIRQRTGNFFVYQWQVLVAVYTASFFIACVGVAYGIFAMQRDGISNQREMTFSSIAVATRKVELDQRGDGETRVRCWPVEERQGSRLYEFRTEVHSSSD